MSPFKKNLTSLTDDPWIYVRTPGTENVSKEDVLAFRASQIKTLRSFGDKHSFIKHQDGQEFLIALALSDLTERLDQPNGNKIDLTAETLLEGKDGLVKRLKEEFRRAKEREDEPDISAVSIKAFVRAAQKSQFEPFTFAGTDIRLSDIREGSSIHGGPTINFSLYAPQKSPFGSDEVVIEGKLSEFRRLCKEATARGENFVDMSDYSMQKFRDVTPAEARRRHEQKSP